MNADLTFNTIVFKKSFDEKDGSERQSTARAINTPDKMIIKSQPYVDASTKVAGNRYTGRIDRHDIDATTGTAYVTSFYFVAAIPSLATSAQVTDVTTTFKAVVADANFIANVLNNEK